MGSYEAAAVSSIQALKIKPQLAEAHNTLGNALQKLARLDEAIASFRRALKIKPQFAEAHVNLANALRSIRQHLPVIAEGDADLGFSFNDLLITFS